MKHLFVLLIVGMIAAAPARGEGEVKGRVTDRESGRPVAGANVTVRGTTLGTVTDSTGTFRLTGVPAGPVTLRVFFLGYAPHTREVVVGPDLPDLSIALAPSTILAQPVTVTATRGRERETPATFSNIERQELRERYTTQDLPVLLSELPSSTYYSESGNGIGYTYLNLRGFDARRVAVMVNGIPQNDPEDHNVYWLDMPDLTASVEDVQVQRGAGSAFYGSPAIGGSINLVTGGFGSERAVRLSAGVGSFNTRKYSASFTSGLIDNRYAFHARLSRILSSGYRDRAWVDYGSYFLGIVRYDETMTTQIHVYGGPVADGLAYYGIPKADVADRDRRRANPIRRPEEIENFSQPHYEFFHEWRLSPTVTLTNTFFHVAGDGFFDYDGSWAPLSYFRIAPQYGFSVAGDPDTLYLPGALIRAQVTNRQWGWLPRVAVTHALGEIILGGELRIHRSVHWGRLQWTQELPADVPYDYRYYAYRGAKDIASAYVHTMTSLGNEVTLMANLQYAFNRYRLYDEKFVGTDFSLPYHFLNPRIGLNWNLDPRWNLYAGAAYTSREPRLKNLYDAAEASTPATWGAVTPQFDARADGTFDYARPLVKPESLVDVEIGAGFRSPAVQAGANLYWMEFTDEIVKSGRVDRFGQPVTGNADRTRHLGLELSGKGALGEGFEISATATVSRNRFIRHTTYEGGLARSLDGNPIAGFPDLLASFRLTYRAGLVHASWGGRYVGRQHTDNAGSEDRTVDPFFVSDASLGCTLPAVIDGVGLEAILQVNNVFDRMYAAYGEGDQYFVGATRNIFFNLAMTL
jgi:iron complex outermembrane receptor protein